MTRDEIAAFWKLGVALKPVLDGDLENIPLTPEGERALDQYLHLKQMMVQEISEISSSSRQQPQDSSVENESQMSLKEAYTLLGQVVEEFVIARQAAINVATPAAEVKQLEDRVRSLATALQVIGTELFAKPKIQQPQNS